MASNAIPGSFPPGRTQESTALHRIADIRYRKPFLATCICGWHETGTSALDIEQRWKVHKLESK